MPPPDALRGLIGRQLHELDHANDRDVARLVDAIEARHPARVAAVLLYGSYLRGKRDTLLDFYVLLDDLGGLPGWQALGNRLLPPNVYHLALTSPDPASAAGRGSLRCKFATMSLGQFEAAMDDFHGYFWSRFTQPAGLVRVHDAATETRVVDAIARAVQRFVATVTPTLPDAFSSGTLWCQGLALTYASELRAEDAGGVADLYRHNARHFDELLEACAADTDSSLTRCSDGQYALRSLETPTGSGSGRLAWALRRWLGKLLSVLRLVKAAGTFDDPLDYLLWKIERHSGIYIEPSDRQRRHPLIFAWPLLWRLYRRGAFR